MSIFHRHDKDLREGAMMMLMMLMTTASMIRLCLLQLLAPAR
jgi:hypothetical protein